MSVEPELGRLLYKIAYAYYEQGLTQKQIGARYGLSRIKVSRLLRQARQLKIVQITLNPLDPGSAELEAGLEAAYGLDEAIIVTPVSDASDDIRLAVGAAGAECLLRSIQESSTVTVTWGTSLVAVVDALPVENLPDVRVIQGLGGLSDPEAAVNAVDVARRMAQALGAKPLLLAAPGVMANGAVRDALLADPQVYTVLEAAAHADIAVVGIGNPYRESVIEQYAIFSPADIERLRAAGGAGDICLRFYDAQGKALDDPINERIIGLDLAQIAAIPRVIGVAGGLHKVEAIRGALRGRLIDVLVTDDQTAAALLELA